MRLGEARAVGEATTVSTFSFFFCIGLVFVTMVMYDRTYVR